MAKFSSVAMFTKFDCAFRAKANARLNHKGISFEETVLGNDTTPVDVKAGSGNATMLQIFFNSKKNERSDDLQVFLQAF